MQRLAFPEGNRAIKLDRAWLRNPLGVIALIDSFSWRSHQAVLPDIISLDKRYRRRFDRVTRLTGCARK